jgi:hypothetical protein
MPPFYVAFFWRSHFITKTAVGAPNSTTTITIGRPMLPDCSDCLSLDSMSTDADQDPDAVIPLFEGNRGGGKSGPAWF